ncbi:MAG TPA: HNH endonuclease [Acidimicrobiales bacterium]|nr:HNH endonuclease [Acidimicrobiales bacterium]
MKPRRKNTIAQAKNRMRRTVEEILDPGPLSIDGLWDHFGAECAYCGKQLSRADREGHVDHAESGGGNHLGNLVLACGACNGDEKRERGWREFLAGKASESSVFASRERRILDWFEANPRTPVNDDADVQRLLAELAELIDEFAAKCSELKAAVAS